MSKHEGEEYVHVLSGTISIEMEGHETVVLERGDGAYYRADRPHRLSAVGPKPAEVFVVASPPHL
jgi:quercetin dioxygenase-like cupin family protein